MSIRLILVRQPMRPVSGMRAQRRFLRARGALLSLSRLPKTLACVREAGGAVGAPGRTRRRPNGLGSGQRLPGDSQDP